MWRMHKKQTMKGPIYKFSFIFSSNPLPLVTKGRKRRSFRSLCVACSDVENLEREGESFLFADVNRVPADSSLMGFR